MRQLDATLVEHLCVVHNGAVGGAQRCRYDNGGEMNLEGMRVMGIDPGLTRCGLSVVQAGRGRAILPVSVGVVRTPSTAELSDRKSVV